MMPLTNIKGRTFGSWKVGERVPSKGGHVMWTVTCSCGNVREVRGDNLLLGLSTKCKSCALAQLYKRYKS